jgi:carboxypeptidase family protein
MTNQFRLLVLAAVAVVAAAGCGGRLAGPLTPSATGALGDGQYTVAGTVTGVGDEGDLPLGGADVIAERGDVRRVASTDADGRYAIEGLPSGPWTVVVGKLGYVGQRTRVNLTDSALLDFSLDRADPGGRFKPGPFGGRR